MTSSQKDYEHLFESVVFELGNGSRICESEEALGPGQSR